MSIKDATELVRSRGRYGDSQLMHVNPQEVAALQTIAQAGGKSLSVNPDTGLPEAFDLGAMLPTLAGTAVGSMVGMPWLGAAIGGMGTYATTGSLEKGLMSGIGAFGGASLGMGLGAAGAGASTAGAGAAGAGTSGVAGGALGTSIGSTSVGAGTGISGSMVPSVAQLGAQASGAPLAAATAPTSTALGAGSMGTGLGPTLQAAQTGAMQGAGALGPTTQAAQAAMTPAQNFAQMSAGDKFSSIGRGIGQLAENPSATWEAMGSPTGSAAMMAAPILTGVYNSEPDMGEPESGGDIRQYDWDPVGRRFVKRPVVSTSDFQGMQPSVFQYQEGGAVSRDEQISKLYQEIVGRPAGASDLAIWNRGNARGFSMDTIASQMRTAPEAIAYAQSQSGADGDPSRGPRQTFEPGVEDANRSQIARMFRSYAQREPTEAEINQLADEIGYGASMNDVLQDIKQSPEVSQMRQAADIEAMYRDTFGRTVDPEGLAGAQYQLQSGVTPEQLRQQLMASPEAAGIRAASQQRVQQFSPMPQNSPDQMISDMYYNTLNRTPEAEGLAFWQNELASGKSPEQVRQMIMTNPEGREMQGLGSGRSAQQIGASTIPYRYQAPVNTPSPGVEDYNQLLANRANYEYVAMPPPDASRPRTPAEMERIRDQQLLGQQMRLQDIQQGGAQAAAAAAAEKPAPRTTAPAETQRQYYDDNSNQSGFAQGGITQAKNVPAFQAGGEMESDAFVVPADVVSALGNGSTSAGVDLLNQYLGMAMPIEGEGDGLSDDIPASIEGDQPARVADGEVYVPASVVAMLGQGDPDRGAAKLYTMMDKIRESAHGKRKQQKEVNPEQVMPE